MEYDRDPWTLLSKPLRPATVGANARLDGPAGVTTVHDQFRAGEIMTHMGQQGQEQQYESLYQSSHDPQRLHKLHRHYAKADPERRRYQRSQPGPTAPEDTEKLQRRRAREDQWRKASAAGKQGRATSEAETWVSQLTAGMRTREQARQAEVIRKVAVGKKLLALCPGDHPFTLPLLPEERAGAPWQEAPHSALPQTMLTARDQVARPATSTQPRPLSARGPRRGGGHGSSVGTGRSSDAGASRSAVSSEAGCSSASGSGVRGCSEATVDELARAAELLGLIGPHRAVKV